jgi:ABC-2 type transport system permease protein
MSGWQKIKTVATFEFLSTVKRPGYLIATFGMPVFMAAYGAVVAVPAYFAEQSSRQSSVHGVVDQAGVLRLEGDLKGGEDLPIPEEVRQALEAAGQAQALDRALLPENLVFRPFATEEEARAALAARQLKGYFVVPKSYMSEGQLDIYSPDSVTMSGSDSRNALSNLLRQRLIEQRIDAVTAARVLKPIERTRRFAVTRTGEVRDGGTAASVLRVAVPIIFMVLFLISVLMTSGYLMQGTATEKENKVVDVLLASANPDEILAGKLLGLGGAGLLQIAVWLGILMVTGLGVVPMLISAKLDVPWLALALAVPFFIIAFLFFGGLMLGTGSLGSNMREAQQLAMVWSLTAAVPLMMMAVLVREPNGTVARVLSWIPFTAAPVVILRASNDAALLAWWEVAGALVVLMLATWIALRLGARLFRIGLLSTGARPSLREIVRQARLTG